MKMIALLGLIFLLALSQVRAEDFAPETLSADHLHGTIVIGSDTFRILFQGKPLFIAKTNNAEPLVIIAKLKFDQGMEGKLPIRISTGKNNGSDAVKLLSSIKSPYETESGEIRYDKDLHLEAYRIRIRPHKSLIGATEKKYEILIDHEELIKTTTCTQDKGKVAKVKFAEMEKVLKDANILGRRVKIDAEALIGSSCIENNSRPFSISEFVE